MQSARLIHFEGLHLDAGCDHIGTVRQGHPGYRCPPIPVHVSAIKINILIALTP